MAFLWGYNGKIITRKIKEEYFRVIMRQEQGWFDENNPYEFSAKVQSQTKTIENGLGMKIGTLIYALTNVISAIIICLITSWKLTLVLMAFFPALALCAIFMSQVIKEGSNKNLLSFRAAGAIAEEILYNIKTVASFANFKFEIDRYNLKLSDSLKAGLKRAFQSAIIFGVFNFLQGFTYTVGIWYSSKLILEKETNFSGKVFEGGDVQVVLNLLMIASYSLGDCTPNFKAINEACASAFDLFELRERKPKIMKTGGIKPNKEEIEGRIFFRDVNFAYPSKSDKDILKKLNINFQPGKSTAIIGASGSGKSTIIYLIQRLYEVTEGKILIDGFDIKDFDLEYLRSLMGYVPQEPILLNASIRDNIVFGRENITDEMLDEACQKAHVVDFVNSMEDGLDSLVGVKGGKLSGGQKQRIAIARAILTQPKFLILDEATSALDNKCQKEVQAALNSVSKGITTLIVAHRLSTIINSDKIIVLSEGNIVEEGNHESLLELNKYYASLIKNQFTHKHGKKAKSGKKVRFEEEFKDENHIPTQINSPNRNPNFENEILPTDAVLVLRETELDNSFKGRVPTKRKSTKKILNQNDSMKRTSSAVQEFLRENAEKEQEINKVAKKSKKRLFKIVAEKKGLLTMAILSSTAMGVIWPSFGLLLGFGIDALSNPDEKVMEQGAYTYAMCFIALAFAQGFATFFQTYSYEGIGEHLTKKLREMTFTKFLRMHMGFFDVPDNSPGALMSKLSSDSQNVNGVILSVVGVLTQTVVTTVVALIIGFIYEWRITLINLGFIPLILLSSMFYFSVSESDVKSSAVEGLAGNLLSESVCSSKSIFTYNMQEKVVEMYHDIYEEEYRSLAKTHSINGLLFGISQFVLYACYATLFYASGCFIYDKTLTLGNFLVAFFSVVMSTFMIGTMQKYVADINIANESLHNIFTILDMPSFIDPLDEERTKKSFIPQTIAGKIEFRNVSFTYPTRKGQVYSNLNFVIPPGKSAAFVGLSGSGKSTLIQLIERYYDVNAGQILIDNVDVREYDLVTLRKFIGTVGQEPVLFKRSIAENIRYGKLDADLEEVKRVAAKAKISSKIEGEDVNVSGGEKQRVAIARAMIRDPKILLLDEATSALDKKIEEEVQKSLEEAMEGRTSIVIAHRLSTIEKCDIIFLMENGRIIEQGSHHELLVKGGKYFDLYNSSQGQ